MKYYILDTKEDSDKCRQKCLNAVVRVRGSNPFTTQWSEEQTRLTDGKYVVPYCQELEDELDAMNDAFEGISARDAYGFLTETSTTEWFPEPEL